jgi:hypothetical protein
MRVTMVLGEERTKPVFCSYCHVRAELLKFALLQHPHKPKSLLTRCKLQLSTEDIRIARLNGTLSPYAQIYSEFSNGNNNNYIHYGCEPEFKRPRSKVWPKVTGMMDATLHKLWLITEGKYATKGVLKDTQLPIPQPDSSVFNN